MGEENHRESSDVKSSSQALLPRRRLTPGPRSLQPTQALRRLPSQITLIALQIASRIRCSFQLSPRLSTSILFGEFKWCCILLPPAGTRGEETGGNRSLGDQKQIHEPEKPERGTEGAHWRLAAVEVAALVEARCPLHSAASQGCLDPGPVCAKAAPWVPRGQTPHLRGHDHS